MIYSLCLLLILHHLLLRLICLKLSHRCSCRRGVGTGIGAGSGGTDTRRRRVWSRPRVLLLLSLDRRPLLLLLVWKVPT